MMSEAKECDIIEDGKNKLSDKGCMKREGRTLYVKECKEQEICEIVDDKRDQIFCKTYIPRTKLPGEYCNKMDECISNICTVEHRCFGVPKNEICKYNSDCDYNFACNLTLGEDHGLCVPLPTLNETCVNGVCDPPYICNKGTCVEFGSLTIGVKADNWLACKNFYIDEGVCIPEYNWDSNGSDATICKYKYELNKTEKTFTEEPVCNNNKASCNPPRNSISIETVMLFINF
jgi:hypothetical protein